MKTLLTIIALIVCMAGLGQDTISIDSTGLVYFYSPDTIALPRELSLAEKVWEDVEYWEHWRKQVEFMEAYIEHCKQDSIPKGVYYDFEGNVEDVYMSREPTIEGYYNWLKGLLN